jgi:hypothetical protein
MKKKERKKWNGKKIKWKKWKGINRMELTERKLLLAAFFFMLCTHMIWFHSGQGNISGLGSIPFYSAN